MERRALAPATLLLSLGLAPALLAQGAGGGTLRGTVVDAAGGVLPGAVVTLVNARTRAVRITTTSDSGSYVFPSVHSGDYRVEVSVTGFRTWQSREVHLSPGDSLEVEARLEVGGRAEGGDGVGDRVLDLDRIRIPAFGETGPLQQPYDFRYPGRWNSDVSLFKSFALGGTRRLQLRAGFFNLFNQAVPSPTWNDIDLDLRTECNVRVDGVPNGAGGTVDGVCDPTQGFHLTDLTRESFGRIKSKHGHRVIELAARFDF